MALSKDPKCLGKLLLSAAGFQKPSNSICLTKQLSNTVFQMTNLFLKYYVNSPGKEKTLISFCQPGTTLENKSYLTNKTRLPVLSPLGCDFVSPLRAETAADDT